MTSPVVATFGRSDYIPRARIANTSYKDGCMDKVTMGA